MLLHRGEHVDDIEPRLRGMPVHRRQVCEQTKTRTAGDLESPEHLLAGNDERQIVPKVHLLKHRLPQTLHQDIFGASHRRLRWAGSAMSSCNLKKPYNIASRLGAKP